MSWYVLVKLFLMVGGFGGRSYMILVFQIVIKGPFNIDISPHQVYLTSFK